MRITAATRVALAVCLAVMPGFGQYKAVNPKVSKVVAEVSEERISGIMETLGNFGTRNLLSSQDDPKRGIGAARRWIYDQFRSYSPRLEVAYDQYRVKKIEGPNSRVTSDVDLYN